MLKDISYALAMAEDAGIAAKGAGRSEEVLKLAVEKGFGADYWPVIVNLIDGSADKPLPSKS